MNRVHLLGNIGQEPELRMTQGGTAILKFSLATSRRWKDQSGQKQEETEWHRIVIFGKSAEGLARYLGKGTKVAVEGRLKYGKYDDSKGDTRYTTDIIVDQLHFCEKRGDSQSSGPSPYGGSYADDSPAKPAADKSFEDDDIPF